MHQGWAVRVAGDRIQAAGPAATVDAAGAKVVELPGAAPFPNPARQTGRADFPHIMWRAT
jgi:hypothetical protein